MSSILYNDKAHMVFLVDVPHSIASAQCLESLLSRKPLEIPYATPEPRSEAAKAKLLEGLNDDELHYHAAMQEDISKALQNIKKHYSGPWCLLRSFTAESTDITLPQSDHKASHVSHVQAVASSHKVRLDQSTILDGPWPPLVLSPTTNHFSGIADLSQTIVHNPSIHSSPVQLEDNTLLNIPPLSTFILSDIMSSLAVFLRSKRLFDFILLDPPW